MLGEKEGKSITCHCRLKPISTNPNWDLLASLKHVVHLAAPPCILLTPHKRPTWGDSIQGPVSQALQRNERNLVKPLRLLPLTLSEVKRKVQHCQWLLQSPMNIPKSNTPTSQNTQRLHYVLLSAQEERSALIEGKMTFTEWIPPVIKGCHYTHGASPRYYWNNFGEGTDEITMEQPGYAILKPFWWWHFIVDRGGGKDYAYPSLNGLK